MVLFDSSCKKFGLKFKYPLIKNDPWNILKSTGQEIKAKNPNFK